MAEGNKSHPLLQTPKEPLREFLTNRTCRFEFYNSFREYALEYQNHKSFFEILVFQEPDIEWNRDLFTVVKYGGTKAFYLSCGSVLSTTLLEKKKGLLSDYHLAPPLICNSSPTSISFSDLVDLLSRKHFILYTGAGISVSSGVLSINELLFKLGIDLSVAYDRFFREFLQNPQIIQKDFVQFARSGVEGLPSAVHHSISGLSRDLQTSVLTENFDHLLERSGIAAIHTNTNEFYTFAKTVDFTQIDGIFCLGLSFDDRGLLSFFKSQNPQGILVALDLKKPVYLGENDYFLQEDLEIGLKEIRHLIRYQKESRG